LVKDQWTRLFPLWLNKKMKPYTVAADAVLFLWRVASMPEEALRVGLRGRNPKSSG
jgi:hypothetical protein